MSANVGLTWPIVFLVLFGALLHASWNVLVKSSSDKTLDTALIQLAGALIGIPLLLFVGLPLAESWPYIVASTVVHIGYYIALSGAYRNGDLGLTYPLMRGVAPILVALSSAFVFPEAMSFSAWGGVLGVCTGVLILGLTQHAFDNRRAVAYALANAVIITIYTVIDGLGARASGNAVQYVVALAVLDGWPFVLLVLAQRGRAAWSSIGVYSRTRWPMAAAGALASLASYGIALWAMTVAPVATISALRETSVLFAVLLGSWLLKEKFTVRRGLGACVIVAGVMALRLG